MELESVFQDFRMQQLTHMSHIESQDMQYAAGCLLHPTSGQRSLHNGQTRGWYLIRYPIVHCRHDALQEPAYRGLNIMRHSLG